MDIDTQLSFETHIAKKVKKANRMVGAIRRSFRYLDQRVFRLLFKGMVRCHLETAVSAWSPSTEGLSDKMERVQQQATAMLPVIGDLPYGRRLHSLKLTTLKLRRLRGDMIETYKVLHHVYAPIVAPPLPLQVDQPGRAAPRLHPLTLATLRSSCRARSSTFTRRVIPVWNSLTPEAKDAPSVNAFKARLD